MKNPATVITRVYTLPELAELYGTPVRTFRRKMKQIEHLVGKRVGYWYTIDQVKIVFEEFGNPFIQDEG